MRHVGSFILASVFAPAVFLLAGTGLSAFDSATTVGVEHNILGTLTAIGALLLAGLLYGILVMARLSPFGPGLAGIAGLGISGWALLNPEHYDETFALLDVHMGGAVGQTGLGFLLAIPLLATITSPRRWRRLDLPVYSLPAPVYPASAIPDPTHPLPLRPEYVTLPDVAAPSLGYPAVDPSASAALTDDSLAPPATKDDAPAAEKPAEPGPAAG